MSRAYVAGMFQVFRGAQLICLIVPNSQDPSEGGSGLGMARRG